MSTLIERDIAVPMRDGVVLRADVYRPAEPNAALPVLLERTPYDKRYFMTSGMPLDPLRAAEHGYVVVIQDVRGRFASSGEFYPFINEADDGYDTVEWCAAQPWCNGNVGIYGSSYMGATSWQAAVSAPPHLKTIIPSQASSSYFEGRSYRGGVPELGSLLTTVLLALAPGSVGRLQIGRSAERKLLKHLRELADNLDSTAATRPLASLFDAWPQGFLSYLNDWMVTRTDGPYWTAIGLHGRHRALEVPVLHMTSWFDSFLDGTLENYEAVAAETQVPQRLIIGPWTHHVPMAALLGSARVGDLNCGLGSMLDFDAVQLAWFDLWLKGISETRPNPPVRLFVMGSNRWRDEQQWPPASEPRQMFIASRAGANGLAGDGRLVEQRPLDGGCDVFEFDPDRPVPTLGGAHVMINTSHPAGSFDQRGVEGRLDVLVYTSSPLVEELEVNGRVKARLFVRSSAVDTDFTAKLVDVGPDGRAMNVCDGIRRLSLREGNVTAVGYEPGRQVEVEINMSATAYAFAVGHAVRIEISSSNFPRFEPNLNTGENAYRSGRSVVASQTVAFGSGQASYIELPVVAPLR